MLAPWPNRIRDGVWEHGGVTHQLDITEVDRENAIHGLLQHSPYRLAERDDVSVTLAADVHPQRGYPFALETSVRYELTGSGVRVTHLIRNVGSADAPVAVGTHPFLRVGDVPTEDLEVVIDAHTHIEVDPVRLNPTGVQAPVDGTRFDLRQGVRVRDAQLDDAWADAAWSTASPATASRRPTAAAPRSGPTASSRTGRSSSRRGTRSPTGTCGRSRWSR